MKHGTKITYKDKPGIWICYLNGVTCLIRMGDDLLNTTARIKDVEKCQCTK